MFIIKTYLIVAEKNNLPQDWPWSCIKHNFICWDAQHTSEWKGCCLDPLAKERTGGTKRKGNKNNKLHTNNMLHIFIDWKLLELVGKPKGMFLIKDLLSKKNFWTWKCWVLIGISSNNTPSNIQHPSQITSINNVTASLHVSRHK